MRRNVFIVICALVALCHSMFGQEAKKAQEPEFIGIFNLLDPATGALVPLERQNAEIKVKVKALGFGGGEGLMEINGEQSPVRFKADQKLDFVVRVASTQIDPMNVIQFYSLESKKGKRRLTITKVGTMAISSKSTMNEKTVSFNVAKHGESSFRVVPAQSLPPGEYVLSTAESNFGFCFGIDPASPKN